MHEMHRVRQKSFRKFESIFYNIFFSAVRTMLVFSTCVCVSVYVQCEKNTL